MSTEWKGAFAVIGTTTRDIVVIRQPPPPTDGKILLNEPVRSVIGGTGYRVAVVIAGYERPDSETIPQVPRQPLAIKRES